MERPMGEIAKRVKNKWMHWGTTGLARKPAEHTPDEILQPRNSSTNWKKNT